MTPQRFSQVRNCVVILTAISSSTLLSGHSSGQQTSTSTLSIAGDVRTPLSVTPAELKAMPRTSVETKAEAGRTLKYEGVLVGELSQPITRDNAVKAIAAFERSIVSARSPYDRYLFDRDETAISDAANRPTAVVPSVPAARATAGS
jgi:cytochrome c peroxidase